MGIFLRAMNVAICLGLLPILGAQGHAQNDERFHIRIQLPDDEWWSVPIQLGCDAPNGVTKRCHQDLRLPPRYQACEISFWEGVKIGNPHYDITPSHFIFADTERPPRFTGYMVLETVTSRSGTQGGSALGLSGVTVRAVPLSWTNVEKGLHGCNNDSIHR